MYSEAAFAFIKDADLKKEVALTEEAALLSQVDAVSLHMTSDRVAYAPRLNSENIIEVETTVLAPDLTGDSGRARAFVTRQIETFIKVLKERLPIYAPSIAKTFDERKDIKFVVNATPKRVPVATWYDGEWMNEGGWLPMPAPVPVPSYPQMADNPTGIRAEKKGKLGCDCPARK